MNVKNESLELRKLKTTDQKQTWVPSQNMHKTKFHLNDVEANFFSPTIEEPKT